MLRAEEEVDEVAVVDEEEEEEEVKCVLGFSNKTHGEEREPRR